MTARSTFAAILTNSNFSPALCLSGLRALTDYSFAPRGLLAAQWLRWRPSLTFQSTYAAVPSNPKQVIENDCRLNVIRKIIQSVYGRAGGSPTAAIKLRSVFA